MFLSRENLDNNSDLIIGSIAYAYETGLLEDPNYAITFTSLLALLCEGKVEGSLPSEAAHLGPIWKLTEEYEEELMRQREALAAENVVVGPW